MRIGICDDEILWCKKASQIIEDHGKEHRLHIELMEFTSKAELDKYSGEPLDVLFVDIELGGEEQTGENGIDLAYQINRRWEKCQIVYLTNYLFYATEIYRTMHVFFVLKEQFESRVGDIFQKILHNLEQKKHRLIFNEIGGNTLVLAPEEIMYFERNGRVTEIVTSHGRYEVWDKLDEVMKRLSKIDFIRCHNSYIVYLPAVRELTKKEFILNDDTEILISRSHAKDVKNAFMQWAVMQMS